MKATKASKIQAVKKELDFSSRKSNGVVETLLELIKQTLESGEDVMISGFGKFCVKQKNKRRGRNPATGEDLMIDERKVISFKCSGKLRKRINAG